MIEYGAHVDGNAFRSARSIELVDLRDSRMCTVSRFEMTTQFVNGLAVMATNPALVPDPILDAGELVSS